MSKGSLFWANARGKLGESVYYRSGGEQRNRTYVKNIKNPRTKSQMVNRIQMSNLAAVYRTMKPILDYSFPDKKSSQSAWNEFVKKNKRVNGAVCAKSAIELGLCVPHGMVMSSGSVVVPTPTTRAASQGNGYYGFLIAENMGENPTVAALVGKFLENNNLPSNAKLTVVYADYADEGYEMGYLTMDATSGILSKVNTTHTVEAVSVQNGAQAFLNLCEQSEEIDVAFIVSYTDGNGKLQISTSSMKTASTEQNPEYALQFMGPDGEVYLQVLNTYGYSGESVLSTR